MNLLVSLIEKEKPRNEYMRQYYENEIASLPKGSIVKKKVGNNEYYYLKYRDGSKTITDYLGKDLVKIESVRSQIERRKHFEYMLIELNKEHNLIKKMLEVAK